MDNLNAIQEKINEVKKRIILSEGERVAKSAEWEKLNSINQRTIANLKKEIKTLNRKCMQLNHPLQPTLTRPLTKQVRFCSTDSAQSPTRQEQTKSSKSALKKKPSPQLGYSICHRSVDDAIEYCLNKKIEVRKQLDVLRYRFRKAEKEFEMCLKRRHELRQKAKRNPEQLCDDLLEEIQKREKVELLENDIHCIKVRMLEAEQIRKKYKTIEKSLMNDGKYYESNLREIDKALSKQQIDIDNLKKIHSDALEMRNMARNNLKKEEQHINYSQKCRECQSYDYYRKVDEQKMQLEQISRRLFADNYPAGLQHQDSMSSNVEEELNTTVECSSAIDTSNQVTKSNKKSSGGAHLDEDDDEDGDGECWTIERATKDMKKVFHSIMIITGAMNPEQVLEQCHCQQRSTQHLNYLREMAEKEKSHLEQLNENLTRDLESMKFSNVKEQETNQETLDDIRTKICEANNTKEKNIITKEYIENLIQEVNDDLDEIVLTLLTAPEMGHGDAARFIGKRRKKGNAKVLIRELIQHMISVGKINMPLEDTMEDTIDPSNFPLEEKMPTVKATKDREVTGYKTLIPAKTFQSSGGVTSGVSGATGGVTPYTDPAGIQTAPTAVTAAAIDEEAEIPTRASMKRQSAIIVEQKSRRKPIRSQMNDGK